jgi:isocitrate dehydrogenase kinase/phosphatase
MDDALRMLVTTVAELSELFRVTDDQLDYDESVTPEERREMQQFVAEHWGNTRVTTAPYFPPKPSN